MMKKILFLLSFGHFLGVQGNQRQETFLKAGAQYDQGSVKNALALYESLESKTPSVLYNMGLCYYTLGQYPKALAYFRKAQKKADSALSKKVSQAIMQVQDKLQLPHDSYWYTKALLIESYGALFAIQILFLLLLAALIVCLWWRLVQGLRLALLVILLLMAGGFCAFDYWFSHQRYAVVVGDEVSVYAGPDKEYHKVATVRSGQEVKVVQESQSWYKVSFREIRGWIEQTDLD